jgi:Bifunctional DNA primase/polymerase, N-terminal/Primase C terminal 1 (PriCT-1)
LAEMPSLTASPLDWALFYATEMKWPVFPLWPKSKLPLISTRFGGHGCRDATTDPDRIRYWWQDVRPDANIGVATGSASGIFPFDVDPKNGGEDSLADLEQQHGALPETVISYTGGGGQHFLFQHVPGLRNSAGKLGRGLDGRGDGGYIVVSPSIHETGRQYVWDSDRGPGDLPIAAMPEWLLNLFLDDTKREKTAALPEKWRRMLIDGVGEGARNASLASLSGHFFRRGIDGYVVLAMMLVWNRQCCRPPLSDDEVVKTVDSIAFKELKRRGRS